MSRRRATFLIMGDGCTRGCRFCSVKHYGPRAIDPDEPEKIREAVCSLDIRYVVITSVSRDDLPFGGADIYKNVVEALRKTDRDIKIELLIPDFGGDREAYDIISGLEVDVINHNMETVSSLYPAVRPEADYIRSLELLRYFRDKGFLTKSGIIVGLGEGRDELKDLFQDLALCGVSMLTIGQYLKPSNSNIDVVKYYTDEEFEELKQLALSCGIDYIFSGRYVRSSYSAEEQYEGVNV
ncbi:MAG: lipoyl synthase, partial [Deltaproteobacteria bacterium]|nr:lipoyl synthase [Deltaproteobacteria bacterium]